mmetsp:Transcript_2965/g.4267  ORF Transcript_2965/g.4267 Transcript_2965/m.4267 type:complete len:144 (-) Transcript_2965:1624-2055(-)
MELLKPLLVEHRHSLCHGKACNDDMSIISHHTCGTVGSDASTVVISNKSFMVCLYFRFFCTVMHQTARRWCFSIGNSICNRLLCFSPHDLFLFLFSPHNLFYWKLNFGLCLQCRTFDQQTWIQLFWISKNVRESLTIFSGLSR